MNNEKQVSKDNLYIKPTHLYKLFSHILEWKI